MDLWQKSKVYLQISAADFHFAYSFRCRFGHRLATPCPGYPTGFTGQEMTRFYFIFSNMPCWNNNNNNADFGHTYYMTLMLVESADFGRTGWLSPDGPMLGKRRIAHSDFIMPHPFVLKRGKPPPEGSAGGFLPSPHSEHGWTCKYMGGAEDITVSQTPSLSEVYAQLKGACTQRLYERFTWL